MRFALVRGRGVVSGMIQWFTRSVYSHAAIVFADGVVYEATPRGFVRAAGLSENNGGCQVDLFAYVEPLTAAEVSVARAMCEGMLGRNYDYTMLLGFPGRLNFEPASSQRQLFCSESLMLVAMALGPGRRLLERVAPWKVPPDWIPMSPRLRWDETVVPEKKQ